MASWAWLPVTRPSPHAPAGHCGIGPGLACQQSRVRGGPSGAPTPGGVPSFPRPPAHQVRPGPGGGDGLGSPEGVLGGGLQVPCLFFPFVHSQTPGPAGLQGWDGGPRKPGLLPRLPYGRPTHTQAFVKETNQPTVFNVAKSKAKEGRPAEPAEGPRAFVLHTRTTSHC